MDTKYKLSVLIQLIESYELLCVCVCVCVQFRFHSVFLFDSSYNDFSV